MMKQTNKKRRETEFEVGDLVWVKSDSLRIGGNSKLRQRYVGPFPVEVKYSPVSYRVRLPDEYRVHPVFHSSVLKPRVSGEQEVSFRPPPVDFDENEFEVDKILNERWNQRKKRREFLFFF